MEYSVNKKLMIDESNRLPRFKRIHATYQCGCSIYNDSWKDIDESNNLCKEHNKSLKAHLVEAVVGIRPEKTEDKISFFKLYKSNGSVK